LLKCLPYFEQAGEKMHIQGSILDTEYFETVAAVEEVELLDEAGFSEDTVTIKLD